VNTARERAYLDGLAEAVAQLWGIERDELFARARTQNLDEARCAFYWRARDGITVTAIGEYAARNHSTISKLTQRFAARMRVDRRLAQLVTGLPVFAGDGVAPELAAAGARREQLYHSVAEAHLRLAALYGELAALAPLPDFATVTAGAAGAHGDGRAHG